MSTEQLSAAVQLIKAGNKLAALPILREIVQNDPNNENAWLWLYSCVEKPEQKIYCLQQALKANPGNENARKTLEKLGGQVVQSAPSVQAVQAPPPSVQAEQAQVPPPPVENIPPAAPAPAEPQKPARKSKTLRTMLILVGIVIVLVCCVGGAIFGWTFVSNRFFNQSKLIEPNAGGSSLTQVGVFLISDGSLVKMERNRGEPSTSGTPRTDNKAPSFILNDPEIDTPNLIFGKYSGHSVEKIAYNLAAVGGAYQVDMTGLSNGTYCFAQYGTLVAPGQADMWCVQIGG